MPPDQIPPWIQGLPPEMRDAMMQYIFGMGMGQFPVNPYEAMTPGVAYGYTPEMDKYGNVQPYDLTTARNNLNLIQDAQGTMVDPVFTALAGPEAYSPDAFTPTVVPGTGNTEALDQLAYYSNLDQFTTMEGFIANAMQPPNNMSASQAYAEFLSAAEANPQLASQIPKTPIFDQITGTITGEKPDPGKVYEFATTLQDSLSRVSSPEMEASPMTKWYQDQGLPLPTEQYGQGNYDPARFLAPGAIENFQAADEALPIARAAASEAQSEHQALMEGLREQSARLPSPAKYENPGPWRPEQDSRDWEGEAPAVKAWWEAQDAATSLRDGALDFIGSPDLDAGTLARGAAAYVSPWVAGARALFSKPKPKETTGKLGPTLTSTPRPGMEPTTVGRRNPEAAQRNSSRRNVSRTEQEAERAKRDRRAAYDEVFLNPDYLYEKNRMEGYQRAGRNPTQDALMQRQMANYLLGVYGPRG